MKSNRFMRICALMLSAVLALSAFSFALAQGTGDTSQDNSGNVEYTNGQSFVYSLRTQHLTTENSLWNFKNVMPGDTRTTDITISNTRGLDVMAYIRATPLSSDAGSNMDFLKQLTFAVKQGETVLNAGLTLGSDSWPNTGYEDESLMYVELGRINNNMAVDLTVEMSVPKELPNDFQEAVGKIEWTIGIVELTPFQPTYPPVPTDNPVPTFPPTISFRPESPVIPLGPPVVTVDDIPLGAPLTGDATDNTALIAICATAVSVVLVVTILFANKRRKKA